MNEPQPEREQAMVKQGDRVRLVNMPADPCLIAPGTEGTVDTVHEHPNFRPPFTQIGVTWDGGRRLMMTVPPDEYEVLT